MEGATGGPRDIPDRPFDYKALRNAYRSAGGKGAWMVNNGYDKAMAETALASGAADLVAFGRLFISNPDLVERLLRGASLSEWDPTSFYGGGARGYIDYPALEAASAAGSSAPIGAGVAATMRVNSRS
mgnify:CR=1 FL=1